MVFKLYAQDLDQLHECEKCGTVFSGHGKASAHEKDCQEGV